MLRWLTAPQSGDGMKHLSFHAVAFAVLCSPHGIPAPVEAQHFPPDEELRLMLRYIVEETGTPGVVLGVLEADGATRVVSYGDPGPGAQPLGPRSGFQIASVTKTFTATLLADMVQRGEVALEDPVTKHLPEHVTVPSYRGREITLLDLATHTSGLPSWPGNLRLRGNNPLVGYATEDLYAFLSSHQLSSAPGTGYLYSNVGYGLLGHALARAAGMSFRDLLRDRVFAPLGMERSDIAVAGELGDWMAVGHMSGSAVPHWFATEALQGAGAAVSTAEDLLKFLRANGGAVTTDLERALRMAQQVRVRDGDRGAGWGFSWRTGAFPDGTLIRGHGGEAGGWRSRITFLPDRGIGVVVLANDVSFAEDLETTLLYLEPPPDGWADVAVERHVLARYPGTYTQRVDGRQHFIRLEGEGYLTHQAGDSARTRLYARSDTTFQTLRRPVSFTFRADGGPDGMTIIIREDERSRRTERANRTAVRVSADTPPPARAAALAENAARAERRGRGVGLIGLAAVVALAGSVALLLARRA
jgi:serine-type D-Ala-D-Ala carboxypeptidase/endopeptidase